jgi:hypothetical protein
MSLAAKATLILNAGLVAGFDLPALRQKYASAMWYA